MADVRVRIAPSPTGPLHIGTARTALYNYLHARHVGGTFILRLEDTDQARSSIAYEKDILDGLHWLGLTWDEGPEVAGDAAKGPHAPYRQMERLALYAEAARRLLAEDRAYPCYCTPDELAAERVRQEAAKEPPRYWGRCAVLTPEERAAFEAEGRRPAIRFRVGEGTVAFDDIIRGHVEIDVANLGGDFVIVRADGSPLYHFVVVVDDAEMAITDVIRGEDHLSNTPKHILLFRALGFDAVMVNCNPETVSTDYDTSDRLYFEPLSREHVLEVCARERPVGVVTQFGGQTPLKLAGAIEEAGYRILGTPHAAIDLAEDRERFGTLARELGVRCPPWAIASSRTQAIAAAADIGYPVLVRPSYVLGGHAMRICYQDAELEAAMEAVQGPVLVDRFVEHAIELDVDALCDGEEVYIAAVMQHVEEAGVHSGDSACVLPAPSLTLAAALEVEHVVKRLGLALGVVGLLNVQLAIADQTVYVLEANPRASRTVPFASKAIGVNLVDAACRIAAGATLRELDLTTPRPTQVSVKAAVLPFSRFPGADPVLGPEMRSTGEVMASAADLPTALAKAERAAGRPLPTSGTAFLSVRDEDKPAAVSVAAALAGLGFDLVATEGTARTLRAAGLELEVVAKVAEADAEQPTVVDLVRRGRCDLVVNTPQGSGARADGYLIREAALAARVPCITTLAGAAAAVHAIANARAESALSLQERIEAGA